MKIIDQENVNYTGTFNEEIIILGGRNIVFDNAVFHQKVKINVSRDIESISFGKSIFNAKLQIAYNGDEGEIDGLLIDTCRFNQNRMQIFYQDFHSQKRRRTKGLIIRDTITSSPTESAYMLENCDSPITENNVIVGVGGVDNRNGLQINGCLNPVIRNNKVMDTVSTSPGDGSGIIIDWCVDRFTETEDALVEGNVCINNHSSRAGAGIENYRGIRSIIRRNTCIGNNNGLRFVKHSDYHAYGNKLIDNGNDALFYECTLDGYEP